MSRIADEKEQIFSCVARLTPFVDALKKSRTTLEKLEVLNRDPSVSTAWHELQALSCSSEEELILKSLLFIGQAERIWEGIPPLSAPDRVRSLIADLIPVETFYKEMGGIVGYHWTLLHLLLEIEVSEKREIYHQPQGIDLSHATEEVRQWTLAGVRFLPWMSEMYPVGGAADRLRLSCPETGEPLPAAKLLFVGKTLLERLILDLQAREYLYYQLFGKQLVTPITLMTSQEKENNGQILALCREKNWFGRPPASFTFFCQPTVPTVDRTGNWCLMGLYKPLLKPGGHGVMWKVAKDQGVLQRLLAEGRKKILVRQINNPLAGCDYGLLAFTGIGCQQDKTFGFASCLRQVGAAEGVNVLIERRHAEEVEYCLTNIEYCDFKKYGIVDEPSDTTHCYSKFPSNTNILFADIASISETVEKCPLPGMVVNLKKISYFEEGGKPQEKEVARLESTMQNIADCFAEKFRDPLPSPPQHLQTFLTFNQRRKTISTAKKEFLPGSSLLETPEGCYYDLLLNAHELLTGHCHFALPDLPSLEEYMQHGPSFHFLYHPALGPLYAIIAQKIRGGRLHEGSEWIAEIAELAVENLEVNGSLQIIADQVMGHRKGDAWVYSDRSGRCILKNVTVRNAGIDYQAAHGYWKQESVCRQGFCQILLHGSSTFFAEDLVLEGNLKIEVEDGTSVTALMREGKLVLCTEKQPEKKLWNYTFGDHASLLLKRT